MLQAAKIKLKANDRQLVEVAHWLAMFRAESNYAKKERADGYYATHLEGNYCDTFTKAECCPLTCCVSKHGVTTHPDNNIYKKTPTKENITQFPGDYCDVETGVHYDLANNRQYCPLTCHIGYDMVAGSAKSVQTTNLPHMKKSRPWYKQPNSTALQQVLIDVDVSYKNFFDGKSGFPKFKSSLDYKSFRITSTSVQWNSDAIYVPKLGWIAHFSSKELPDMKDKKVKLKSITFTLEVDGLYASMLFDYKDVPDLSMIAASEIVKVLGCDMGLTKYLHCSDGEQFDNPRFATTKKAKRQLRIRNKRLSRKKKGSKNREKERQRYARTHQKIVRKREAFLWKLAMKLIGKVGKNGCIVLEDL